MTEYGTNGRISHDRFVDFLVGAYGNTENKEEIINGFRLINRGEVALPEKLKRVMEDPDVDYITQTAPKKDKGYDFVAWCEDVFSR